MNQDDLGTVTENPVIKDGDLPSDFDADDAKFRQAAELADSGQDIPADLLGVKPETSEKPADSPAERPRDALGRFTKTEAGDDIPESERKPVEAVADAAAKTDPPVSEFEQKKQEKAAKEKERQDRSWENLNRQKEELEQRRKEFEDRTRQPQQPKQQPQPREFSSQQLLEASDDFKKNAREAFKRYQETGNEADLDEFNRNDQLSDQAFQNAGEFYAVEQQEAQQQEIEKHNKVWVANMESEIKAMPDLGKPDSPIAIQMLDLLKTRGAVFQMMPDGFKVAKEIAQLRLDAAEAPTLRERVKALEAEKTRLDGLLTPEKGGVTSQPSTKGKSLDDMNETEQDEFFRRAAQEVDAQHRF